MDERVLVSGNRTTGSLIRGSLSQAKVQADGRALRWLPSLSSLALLFPVALLYWQVAGPSSLLVDPNSGVHVRAGEWILSHHAVPREDLFSFTLAGSPWCDWEWLSDALYAVLFQARGLRAIAAFHLGLLCLISVVLYRTARLRAGPTVAFAVTYLVMAATTIHWLARPHLFSWLFLAVFGLLLEKIEVTGDYRLLLASPVLMILWVNLHPGFLMGLLAVGAWSGSAVVRWRFAADGEDRSRRRNEAFWFCLTLTACFAATFVNPYGWRLDGHILSYLFSSSSVTSRVAEWLPPDFRNPRLQWFELLLPLGVAAGLRQGLRGHLAHCALVLGSMHLALTSVRNVPLFAIVAAGPLAAAGAKLAASSTFALELRAGKAAAASRSKASTIVCYALAFAALLGILWRGPIALGSARSLPVDAARHLPTPPTGPTFGVGNWSSSLSGCRERDKAGKWQPHQRMSGNSRFADRLVCESTRFRGQRRTSCEVYLATHSHPMTGLQVASVSKPGKFGKRLAPVRRRRCTAAPQQSC
ncbi:MAG TPA: hypothetical protein VMS37_25910 [Verrucomicrobiae bacterium]|nr:hypothetical protein [Verrucomicrobiae bacterium]